MTLHGAHRYPIVIRERHLDSFGHVNNATYLELMEEARWESITERGYGLEKIRETGQGPTILEIHLLFIQELRLRESVVIHTQLITYEKKIAQLKQWITNAEEKVCCEAVFKIGLFDVKARKLILPTVEWRNALGAV
jgi:thioesterase-3